MLDKQTIIQVLGEEFCGGLSDLRKTPDCGNACNIRAENIIYEDTGNTTSVYVNFECAIKILYYSIFFATITSKESKQNRFSCGFESNLM